MSRDRNVRSRNGAAASARGILLAAGLSACAAAAVDAFLLAPRRLTLERIDIPIFDLPDSFDGYRIALLSDLHYPLWSSPELVRRAVALANTFQPDLIAVAGDICDRHRDVPAPVPSLAGLFDGARAADGIVGVLGNHDHWFDVDRLHEELARNTPVRLIENRSTIIERDDGRIAVGGVGDLMGGVVLPAAAFEGVPESVPRILISHNPDVADRMRESVRIDLQLSGHTHGGQVGCHPGFALVLPRRYGYKMRVGLVEGRSHRVYISRGVASTHNVRFLCTPEVSAVTLRKSCDPQIAPRRPVLLQTLPA